jgi:predicted nucleic acid-binding protein
MMTGSKKIFFDTAPFIYLIENHTDFYQKVADFLMDAVAHNCELSTSVLTYAEFSVKPFQLNRLDLITDFEDLLESLDFTILNVDMKSATIAYKLRAKYKSLKGIDALQISIAIATECHEFLTNDKRLQGVKEIKVVVVDDLP